MARMIPAQIDRNCSSQAEKRIFGLLKNDPSTKDWTVLHSLGLARRPSGPYGEIDFVVIIPSEGIVCLEVKGGRISCNTGMWQTMDRYGKLITLKKSPFQQVREGMFAMRKSIIKHFGGSSAESQCPIASAVVFPDVVSPPLTPEFDRSDVIDLDDLRNPISKSIMRVVRRRLRELQPRSNKKHPTGVEANSIRQYLRPDFELIVAKNVCVGYAESKLLSLTEEQYVRLDELEANSRCIFEGAAGTGKTLLALEFARRASYSGMNVLFVCFNRLLGEWLQSQTIDMDIIAGTWHAITRKIILTSSLADEFENLERETIRSGKTDKLFNELYPLYGMGALAEMKNLFDVLVIDEAQDLCNGDNLELFNLAIHGGLAGGRWAIFGDFTRQALYGNPKYSVEELSRYCEHFVRAKLTLNCRNTKRIAEETTIFSGFEKPPYRMNVEKGLPVEHRYWQTHSDLVESLTSTIKGLIEEKISLENIMLICSRRIEYSSLAGVNRILDYPIIDCSGGLPTKISGGIKYSTIHSYKGMESQVVIVLDIDAVVGEQAQSLLYVAMSRARSLLILMINKRVKKSVEACIQKMIQKEFKYE